MGRHMANAGWEAVGRGQGGEQQKAQRKLGATADTHSAWLPKLSAGLGQGEYGMGLWLSRVSGRGLSLPHPLNYRYLGLNLGLLHAK